MTTIKRVYLSGPISSLPEEEFRKRFETAEMLVKKMNDDSEEFTYEVVNPLKVPACPTEDCNPDSTEKMADGSYYHSHRCYMKHDLDALLDCDIIILLPGWQDSPGAQVEFQVARVLGLQVMAMLLFGGIN